MADQCFSSNPDVAGIGIRINFYTTILFAILTPEKEYTEELLSGIYRNSIINGLGLLFTAVIQTVQGTLDLYHAIFVIYILFYLNVTFLFGERRFVWSSHTNFQMLIYLWMHALGSLIFFIWLLFAEIDGSKFGSQSSCNHFVIVVLLYANIRATVTWFRVVMIICFAFGIPFLLSLLGFLILAPARWTEVCTNALQKVFHRYPRLRLARYVIGIPLVVCIIVNLELTVHRNRPIIQPGENQWGFGQIIAVILTLGMGIDVLTAIRERCRMRRHPERTPRTN